jgi:hypothetical protein
LAYIHRHAHPQKYSESARGFRSAVHGGAGEMLVELVGVPPLQRQTLGSRDMRMAAARSDRDQQRQGSAPHSHGLARPIDIACARVLA